MYIPDSLIKHWATLNNDSLSAVPTLVSCVISSGQSLSSAASIPEGMRPIAAALPAAWTDSDISFSVSFDNSIFYEVTDGNTTTSPLILSGAGRVSYIFFLPVWQLARCQYVRIRSGSSVSPTNQEADRTIQVVCVNHNASDH
jgi:hypothetical protein